MPHDAFRLGAFEVTPLCDGWAPLPLDDEVPGVEVDWDAERERFPWAFPPDDHSNWAWHVHSFLIRHPDGLALVDTGIGHFGRSPFDVTGRLDDQFDAVGVSVGDVRDVVLTHLHADHSGGVCRPDGTPRFPDARHHVHPDDWTFFAEQRTPDDFTGRFAMVAVEEAGLLDLDPNDRPIAAGSSISVRHAPGHTPGHRVVLLVDGEETLLLTGDLLHTTPQVMHAAVNSNHDEDPVVAAEHRTALVRSARGGGWAVGVGHFGQPFGHVGSDAGESTWEPV